MIRPATAGDLDAVHALFVGWAEDVAEPTLPYEALQAEWRAPGFDPARDHWVEVERGEVVGYAALKASGGVVARGERAGLLPLVVERARERGDAMLEAILTTRDESGLDAFLAAGFRRVRDVHRMFLELRDDLPTPNFPPGVAVRPYEDADARPLHAFVELAYAQNNERIEPFEPWLHFTTAHREFDPTLWHLAEGDGGLVACCLTWAPVEQGGWIKDLAVHPAHRRRGLGEALLHHAHRAYRDRGIERVGLKVDSDNPTAAGRLYERLGYRIDRVYAVLEREP
jgi:ribosomal protein S18 acetylase RimI-like enzyme